MIKCVIWDIDNTLIDGVYLEAAPSARPPADEPMMGVLRELAGRGIVHAIASRNPPEAADYAARLAGTLFAAAECGWDAKPEAIRRILAELGFAAGEVAFVDDEPIERAEVSAVLPEVLVLSPEDAADAPGWPQFGAAVTAEAARRGQMYLERRRRLQEAQAFGGSREDFLRYCGTRVTIGPAAPGDALRLHELSVRTHQFNSAGEQASAESLAALIRSPRHRVLSVRLSDRFGDDGIVGGCVIETGDPRAWAVPLLMMSCRAMGRGVIGALLAWLCRAAAAGGAGSLTLPCRPTSRNVPLRVALAGAGFRAVPGTHGTEATEIRAGPAGPADAPGALDRGGPVLFARSLAGPLPPLPDWTRSPETR